MLLKSKFGYFLFFVTLATAQDVTPPVPIHQVQPEWGPELSHGYLEEPGKIEMIVDADGVPYSLTTAGVDDNIVTALSQWRFRPGKKDGRNAAFSVVVHVPVRRPIDADVERTFWKYGRFTPVDFSKDQLDAIKAGRDLDEAGANALEKSLAANPEDTNSRLSLLEYYAKGESSDAARARLEKIEWLAKNAPASNLWAGPLVQINKLGGPLQDAAGYERVRDIWLGQLSTIPSDPKVLAHAIQFLKIADPEKALDLRVLAVKQNAEPAYSFGEIYGIAAIGVTGIDLLTGLPASAPERIPETPFAKNARGALMATEDTSVLLAGLATITFAGKALAKANHLPTGYAEFCDGLLKRAKQIQPSITTSCDTTTVEQRGPAGLPNGPVSRIRVGGNVQAANLIKKVQPLYPADAKSRHIEGTVRFLAIIDKEGKIAHLTFMSGPLPLYEASRDAVRQWVYKPTLLNGRPVEVVTQIDVNYTLTR